MGEPYGAAVTAQVEAAGGRYLARTMAVRTVEGDDPDPQVMVLIEWPSREAFEQWYQSEEYAPLHRMRVAGTSGKALLFSAEDVSRS